MPQDLAARCVLVDEQPRINRTLTRGDKKLKNWKYIKCFPDGPSQAPTTADLQDLVEVLSRFEDGGESAISAGYTYLGQFITHDLTFLRENARIPTIDQIANTPRLEVDELTLSRKPALDLDSLYGGGLSDSVIPFDRKDGTFILGKTEFAQDRDLPREPLFRPLIGDPRNDENLLIAQMHVLFMNFHNKVVRDLQAADASQNPDILFETAREEVVKVYQYLVLHDFLKALVPDRVYQRIVLEERESFGVPDRDDPKMALEFAAAACRLHSMVRPTYRLNAEAQSVPLDRLFRLTSRAKPTELPLKRADEVDWRFFFKFANYPDQARTPQRAKTMSFVMNRSMRKVPFPDPSRPVSMLELNLLRGIVHGICSGQQAFEKLSEDFADLSEELGLAPINDFILGQLREDNSLRSSTPLWLYLMLESPGSKTGVLGGWIIADVLRTAALSADIRRQNLADPNPDDLYAPLADRIRDRNAKPMTIEDVIMYTYEYQ